MAQSRANLCKEWECHRLLACVGLIKPIYHQQGLPACDWQRSRRCGRWGVARRYWCPVPAPVLHHSTKRLFGWLRPATAARRATVIKKWGDATPDHAHRRPPHRAARR